MDVKPSSSAQVADFLLHLFNDEKSVKYLTFKTFFLLALASGKRRSEIHAFSFGPQSEGGQPLVPSEGSGGLYGLYHLKAHTVRAS